MTILASLNNLRASIRAALDSLENSKLSKSDYTAQDVFAKVKTLHGPGSGLDADTLDGKAAADFAQSVHGHSVADVQGLQTVLDGKVDAVAGFGLSQQNFSQSEKDKLARMDDTQRWKGEFQTLAALQAAWPTAEPGSYAHVDGGSSQDAQKYIYDTTDQKWVLATSKADPLTPAQVKQLYEANADTFAFSSSYKTKLDGVAEGANKYVHPASHPASIITQDANNRFVTDAEKAEWSGKAASSHSHGAATTTAPGFMSAADKTKLNGVAAGATANTGTVTSVQVAVPTGLQVSGGPVTTSGTLTIAFQSGYGLPTNAKQVNWDTAYGWGNHASAGYSKTDTKYTAGSGLTLTGTEFSLPVARSGTGTFVTGVTQTANGLQVTLGTPPNTTYAAMTQAEAEAGTNTNGRLISALRVRQAVAAWWTEGADCGEL